MIQVKLLFFASAEEAAGTAETSVEIPEGFTGEELLNRLCKDYPKLSEYRSLLKLSMNEELIATDQVILPNSTVALFPPFSGG